MKKLLKRFGAMFVVVAMLVAMIPMTVLADVKNGFYLGDDKELKVNESVEINDNHKEMKYYLNDGAQNQNFNCTYGGKTENSSSNPKKIDIAQKFSLESGTWITVKSIDMTSNNYAVTIEVRTGGYVNNAQYTTGTVTKNDVVKYYSDKGEPKNFECFYGTTASENKINTGDKVNEFTIPEMISSKTGPFSIQFIGDEPDNYKVLLTDASQLKITTKPTVKRNLTYTAEPQELINAGEVENGDMYYAKQTSNTPPALEAYAKTIPTEKDAGEYIVWYYAKNEETDESTTPQPILNSRGNVRKAIISPATLKVEWTTEDSYTYDETPKETPTAVIKSGVQGGETPSLGTPSLIWPKNDTEFKNAGIYVFGVELDETNEINKNYKLDLTSYLSVSIAKAKVDVPKVEDHTYIYDGKEKTGLDFADQPYVQVTGKYAGENTATSVGTYKCNIVLTDTKNYEWAVRPRDWFKSVTWKITEKTPEATDFVFTAPDNLEYTGDLKDATVKLQDVYVDETENELSKLTYLDKDGKEAEPRLPGTYKVAVSVKGGNFTNEEVVVGEFTIEEIEFLEGDGSNYVIGKDGTLFFKTNGPFQLFEGVSVDGERILPKYYEAKRGSTEVTLLKNYVDTLEAGEHTIQFLYKNNVKSTVGTFTVEVEKEAPKTGDTNNTWLWILLGTLAGLALVAGAYKTIGSDI